MKQKCYIDDKLPLEWHIAAIQQDERMCFEK